jgi:hypothetical protein
MFTEDGQRRTDTMVLWLFGQPEIKLDLNALASEYTEREIQQVYPNLPWQCEDRMNPYGDRVCVSRIGIFNGIPSHYISAFFHADRLSALKVHYRANNHNSLQSHLLAQLGAPLAADQGSSRPPPADPVVQWRTPHGLVVMKRELIAKQEPALFWLADRHLK